MGTNILVGFPILSWSDRKMIQHYSTNTLVYYCKWWCMYGSAGPKLMWSLGIDTCRWDLQENWYQFLLYTLLDWLSVGWYFGLIIYFICITDIGQDFKKALVLVIFTWPTYFWQVSAVWKSPISILLIFSELAQHLCMMKLGYLTYLMLSCLCNCNRFGLCELRLSCR